MYRIEQLADTSLQGWTDETDLPVNVSPSRHPAGRGPRILAAAISIAVLIASLASLRHVDPLAIAAIMPRDPLFWLLFAISYLAAPGFDWAIFHRLWRIPALGFLPLLRKLIGNEILLGYIGDVYFYAWARRQAAITAAPFGAIKDVAVLSAMVGNAATLIMLAVAWPLYAAMQFGTDSQTLLISIAIILSTSCVVFFFRKGLFSLPPAELRFVAAAHLARIITVTGLTAFLWHLALPAIDLGWWLALATLRLLIARLPLVPNKDVVFAGVSVLLVGQQVEITTLMAMMASLILATHVALGIALTVPDIMRSAYQR